MTDEQELESLRIQLENNKVIERNERGCFIGCFGTIIVGIICYTIILICLKG